MRTDQTGQTIDDEPIGNWAGFGTADPLYPSRGPRPQRHGALPYLLGMATATLCGTAFVVGGLVAGASGLAAVALAAAVPVAGLLWAIALSVLHRGHVQTRRVDGYRGVEGPPR